MGAFTGTAKWYVKYRPAWPAQIIDVVCERFLASPGRVLDLGCGPGTLGIEFGRRGHRVVGIDREPEMIEMATTLAPAMTWHCAAAEDVEFPAASFDLAVLGRSFHWMDRTLILKRLASWLGPRGGIALFSDPTTDASENEWLNVAEDVITRWNPWMPEYEKPNRQIISESQFRIIDEIRVPTTRVWSFENYVGLARSQSKTQQCRKRGEFEAFVADLRSALSPFADQLTEHLNIEVLLLSSD